MYLRERQTKRESMCTLVGEAQREKREKIPSRCHDAILSMEPSVGLNPATHEIRA